MVLTLASLSSGQRILIAGASAESVRWLFQLAKAKGAYVIGLASGRNKNSSNS